MIEFVGLRSKSYTFTYIDNNNIERCDKKLKGIKKNIIKETINFKHYYNWLTLKEEYRKMNTIRSYEHQLYTAEINKKALGAFDKIYILENGINSLPYGYKYKCKDILLGILTVYRRLFTDL